MNLSYRFAQLFTPSAREKIGGFVLLAIVLGIMWFLLCIGGP